MPLITERGVAQPSESALVRLRRTVVEAAKQCGRNQLMEIAPPQRWSDYAFNRRLLTCGSSLIPVEFRLPKHWQRPENSVVNPQVIGAIGPEGGFTDEEVKSAVAAGWQMVDLGPRVLRVETAAIAVAAWVSLAGMHC